jgi:hypothetical protein
MAFLTIILWQDIPVHVTARDGRKLLKKQLSNRFQEAIDQAAMQSGSTKNDTYLAKWRRSKPIECSANLELEIKNIVAELESKYTLETLNFLITAGGIDTKKNIT